MGGTMSSEHEIAPSSDAPAVTEEAVDGRESASTSTTHDDVESDPAEEREGGVTGTDEAATDITAVGVARTSRDPVLPNLAAAALQRLTTAAASATVLDDSADDFQPLRKKRRLKEDRKANQEEGEEGDREVV